MSLLEELLRKAEKRPGSGDIPPELERVVARENKRRYVIPLIIVFSLVSGIALLVVLNHAGFFLTVNNSAVKNEKAQVNAQKIKVEKQIMEVSTSESILQDSGYPENRRIPQGNRVEKGQNSGLSDSSQKLKAPASLASGSSAPEVIQSSRFNQPLKTETRKQGSKKRNQTSDPGLLTPKTRPPVEEKPLAGESRDSSSQRRELLYRANDLEQRGEYEKAIEYYKKILEAEPSDHRVLNQISYLYIKLGLPERAIYYTKRLRELRPDYIPGKINHSVALLMMGEYKEAEGVLQEILDIEPYNKTALYNLAVIFEKEQRYDEAEKLYRRLYLSGDIKGKEGLMRLELKKSLIEKDKDK